ncbi:MAG: hypothetical protein ABL962_14380 [Fimbriimonadaceae bacterium]
MIIRFEPKWSVPFEINPDITQAWTPPTSFYGDSAIFGYAKEAIFAKSWQWITDVDSVKVPGQVFPFTMLEGFLDEPLMFTRDRSDKINCLSNVCTPPRQHRVRRRYKPKLISLSLSWSAIWVRRQVSKHARI